MSPELTLFLEFIERYSPNIKPEECYYVSAFARGKYLDPAQRKELKLQDTRILSRYFIHTLDDMPGALAYLKASSGARTTATKEQFPESVLCTYFKINPCSTLQGFLDFNTVTWKAVVEHTKRAVDPKSFQGLDGKLKACISKTTARRFFVDVDIDTKDTDILNCMLQELKSVVSEIGIVNTRGGFHLLLPKCELGKFNLFGLTKEFDAKSRGKGGGEVIINANSMVPLPTTLQNGHLVGFRSV